MSVNAHAAVPVPAVLRPRRPPPAPRRLHPAGLTSRPVPAHEVRLPDAGQVPDWSPETAALLANLTPLEQAVVQWMAAGYSAAESYRRATGRDPASARQSANQVTSRPRVRAALAAALRDRNVGARVDREWLLQRLVAQIEECEEAGTVRARGRLIEGLRLIAKLQGLLVDHRPSSPPTARATAATDASRRLDELINKAEQAVAGRAARAQVDAADDAHGGGRPPEPRAGGPGPRPELVGAPGPAARPR